MYLIGFTCTYNEEDLVPFVMKYVNQIGYDKFVVFDNMSTDKTVELLSAYDRVEVRSYDTNGVFDEHERQVLFLQAYQEAYQLWRNGMTDVWMSFTDFDEVIYMNPWDVGSNYPGSIRTLLNHAKWHNYRVYDGQMYHLISETLPEDNGDFVHFNKDLTAARFRHGKKPTFFLVDDLLFVKTSPGFHLKQFKYADKDEFKTFGECDCLFSFHLKYLGYKEREEKHYSQLYTYFNSDLYNTEIKHLLFESFPVNEIFKHKALNGISITSGVMNMDTHEMIF